MDNTKKRKKKLTIMMVPHSGSGITSIELTIPFFIGLGILVVGIIFSSMYITYKYVNTKAVLNKNLAYIQEREQTFAKIEDEIKQSQEISLRFTDELEKSKSLIPASSSSNTNTFDNQIKEGDFSIALDVISQKYDGFDRASSLLNISKTMEQNLPLLQSMNNLIENQQNLFTELPVLWPVRGAVVSMEWGPNIHPIYGSWYIHKGFDLAAMHGSPIQSTGQGEVTYIGYDGGYGLNVYISHKYGFKSHYAHMSAINVVKGQNVLQGAVIGKVGSTGQVTGPHLHYELYLGNELVDPGVYLRILNNYEKPRGNRGR